MTCAGDESLAIGNTENENLISHRLRITSKRRTKTVFLNPYSCHLTCPPKCVAYLCWQCVNFEHCSFVTWHFSHCLNASSISQPVSIWVETATCTPRLLMNYVHKLLVSFNAIPLARNDVLNVIYVVFCSLCRTFFKDKPAYNTQ